jgi:hypothetical protein
MGMEKESDPLPAPMSAAASSADHTVWVVPDWQAPIGDGANGRVCSIRSFLRTS